jgi:hypothetical protein
MEFCAGDAFCLIDRFGHLHPWAFTLKPAGTMLRNPFSGSSPLAVGQGALPIMIRANALPPNGASPQRQKRGPPLRLL